MPIYEYCCEDCGTKFEKLVRRASETAELECPSCGKSHLKQELSTFAAHSAAPKSSGAPMCPSGGPCSNPGACGMNFN
jgi:putative FmdB family regulatory protein